MYLDLGSTAYSTTNQFNLHLQASMAEAAIANVVASFIGILINVYKDAEIRHNAQAAVKGNFHNWICYQDRMVTTLQVALNYRLKDYYHIVDQSIWILNQDATMNRWLLDAGFRRQRLTRNKSLLLFPRCGIAGKAKDFDLMFERLRQSYERLQTLMSEAKVLGPSDEVCVLCIV